MVLTGQNTSITVIEDGKEVGEIDSINSFSWTWKVETNEFGCLGEKTDRIHAKYKGAEFNLEMYLQNAGAFKLFSRYVAKAKDQVSTTKFNIKTTYEFPDDGSKAVFTFMDVFFGDFETSSTEREGLVTASTTGRCSEVTPLFD